MRVEKLVVDSIQTYKMTLPNSQNFIDFVFKASENEEKDIEMAYDITRDELAYMAKRIKKVMKFNKSFYKNQQFGIGKRLNEQSSNDKGKSFSKDKKI